MGGETAVEALKVELVNINLMWLNSARKHAHFLKNLSQLALTKKKFLNTTYNLV